MQVNNAEMKTSTPICASKLCLFTISDLPAPPQALNLAIGRRINNGEQNGFHPVVRVSIGIFEKAVDHVNLNKWQAEFIAPFEKDQLMEVDFLMLLFRHD